MAQNIQVFVRVRYISIISYINFIFLTQRETLLIFDRPMSEGEQEQGLPPAVLVPAGSTQRIEVGDRCFIFDRVFGSQSTHLDVYSEVAAPLVAEVLAGYCCTVFAYGQTGSGKTHTMEGSRPDAQHALWNLVSVQYTCFKN